MNILGTLLSKIARDIVLQIQNMVTLERLGFQGRKLHFPRRGRMVVVEVEGEEEVGEEEKEEKEDEEETGNY